jgi:hypothetical protein
VQSATVVCVAAEKTACAATNTFVAAQAVPCGAKQSSVCAGTLKESKFTPHISKFLWFECQYMLWHSA